MLYIVRSTGFVKSLKKLKASGKFSAQARSRLNVVIDSLAAQERLPASYRDHALSGDLRDYRECHIQGDLLLVYQVKQGDLVLLLIDIGSHAQLFG